MKQTNRNTMKAQIYTDIKLTNAFGNNEPATITFNGDMSKCKINDHRMVKCHMVLGKQENGKRVRRYQTTIWSDITVFFEVEMN